MAGFLPAGGSVSPLVKRRNPVARDIFYPTWIETFGLFRAWLTRRVGPFGAVLPGIIHLAAEDRGFGMG